MASAPQPEGTTSASTTKVKRKGGVRKPNHYPNAKMVYVIDEVGEEGQILKPKEFQSKFRNAIGALVRDKLNPSIRNWHDYPEDIKDDLWKNRLLVNFNFRIPAEKLPLVRRRAMKMMGESFRRWRNELNTEYIKKGLTPYHKYGHITPAIWALLVAEKTAPESLALSEKNSLQAKKNIHHPRLGPGGYEGKEEMFRKMEEEAVAAGNTKVMKLKPRTKRWVFARNLEESGSSLKFAKPETEEAVSRIMKYSEDIEKGSFTPSREKDELSLGLGNPEHPGRVRGLGKHKTWKEGFREDVEMYKKHGRNREESLATLVKTLVAKELQEQGLSTERRSQMEPPRDLVLVGSPPNVQSSQGSNAASASVDHIRVPTRCILLIPIGRGQEMAEVATGLAHPPIPGDIWHHKPVPADYSKVEVHTVNPEYAKHKIEHPTSEGIRELGLLMKQFILWYKKDIVLNVSSPTPSDVHLERVHLEDGEVYSPSHEDHLMHERVPASPTAGEQGVEPGHDETPHEPQIGEPSVARAEPEHEMPHVPQSPQPSTARAEPKRDETPHVPHSPKPSTARAESEHDETPHVPPKPQHSPARPEQGHDEMAQTFQQAPPTHEELLPLVCEAREKIPIMIRSTGSKSFVDMNVSGMYKWYAHDQFKPENQGPNKFAYRMPTDTSDYTTITKYPDVETIKWSKDCPKEYVKGKRFLPNRILCKMPYGMRRFHDWYYLHVSRTELNVLEAVIPARTFGGPASGIAFDFSDIQSCFHLSSMSMNLIRTWCL